MSVDILRPIRVIKITVGLERLTSPTISRIVVPIAFQGNGYLITHGSPQSLYTSVFVDVDNIENPYVKANPIPGNGFQLSLFTQGETVTGTLILHKLVAENRTEIVTKSHTNLIGHGKNSVVIGRFVTYDGLEDPQIRVVYEDADSVRLNCPDSGVVSGYMQWFKVENTATQQIAEFTGAVSGTEIPNPFPGEKIYARFIGNDNNEVDFNTVSMIYQSGVYKFQMDSGSFTGKVLIFKV